MDGSIDPLWRIGANGVADARTAFGLIISHDDSRLQKHAHFRRAPAVREAYREDVSSLARTRRLR
jgi:hypothetical protein